MIVYLFCPWCDGSGDEDCCGCPNCYAVNDCAFCEGKGYKEETKEQHIKKQKAHEKFMSLPAWERRRILSEQQKAFFREMELSLSAAFKTGFDNMDEYKKVFSVES